ncbi:MAG: hypothetical protein Q8K26_02605 [Candidatus Gracilibacteria bacterium]|nr:hypothetical protein [Candidatus Gracilibacteria bacterium]
MSKKHTQINDRFVEYFRETFFADKPEELAAFLSALTKPLPKTIRVNTNRISVADFEKRAKKNGWILTPTPNPTVFRIDRVDTRLPLGHTLEHLLGYFYIQELSASMSVHYLTQNTPKVSQKRRDLCENGVPEGTVRNSTVNEETEIGTQRSSFSEAFIILDMAASPGGKTTQLREHYPNATIVANEPTRDRMAQLVQNIERMGANATAITNYDGSFYGNVPETFDRILLDAPCSGEGIGFKESQTVRYWNLKNIHTIARLQTKLLDAAFRALKTGGELLYSTCTLNQIENEGVVETIRERYPESFEILFEKRFWPHEELSGGFFVCKIRKNTEIAPDEKNTKNHQLQKNEEITPINKESERILTKFTEKVGLDLEDYLLFQFKKDILAIRKNQDFRPLLQELFFVRLGQKIGRIEDSTFTPDNRLGRDFKLTKTPVYQIQDAQELDDYLRGAEIGVDMTDGWYVLQHDGLTISLERGQSKNGKLTNTFPREWMRK